MCIKKISILLSISMVLIILLFNSYALTQTLYVDVMNGNDKNPGTKEKPLMTLKKAAEITNSSTMKGPSTIKVAPGIYNLNESVVFENSRLYTEKERLTIEAVILPDDPQWKPDSMPVLISTEFKLKPEKSHEPIEIPGLKVEVNHVTIRGLKFLGSPTLNIWYYPIGRLGKNLKDLIVSQCLFMAQRETLSMNVAILANGHGLVVDHCIFYNCRNPVVFWNAEGGISKGNVMKYCIVDGAFTSGIWVCQTGEDLEFHHNIITNCEYIWMRDYENTNTYRLRDCIITNYKHYSAKCGPNWEVNLTGPDIEYEEKNIIKEGKVILEKGNGIDIDVPRTFLHVVPGTLGSKLGAGLFISNW